MSTPDTPPAGGHPIRLELAITDVRFTARRPAGRLRMRTDRGTIAARLYGPPPRDGLPAAAAIWLTGTAGGWHSPARGLYSRLCRSLAADGVASLRVRYRRPGDFGECVLDALACMAWLEIQGVRSVALVGHSFGASVAIQAAAHTKAVRAVVTLAAQNSGTGPVGLLGPRCALLCLHGKADGVLPAWCTEDVFARALPPKRHVVLDGAGHDLRESAGVVRAEVGGFLRRHLPVFRDRS